jgi:hypothetical protein
MKTLLLILIAMFIGTSVTFAQQNTSSKASTAQYQKIKTGVTVKNINKENAPAAKSMNDPATIKTDQKLAENKNSGTSGKLVRVPVKSKKVKISARSSLKEK